ncbi:hypothetical protein ACHAQA_006529 [Verticillium albo-atrum]
MKFALSLLALTGVATAATLLDSLPECSHECITEAVANGTPCELTDSNCICEPDNYRNTYSVGQACVILACGAVRSIEEVLPGAAGFCASVTGGSAEITESGLPQPTIPSTAAPSGTAASTAASNATASDASPTETGAAPSGSDAADDDSAASTYGRVGAWGVLALGALAFL